MTAQKVLTLPGGLKIPTIGLGTHLKSLDENEEVLVNALNIALEKGYRELLVKLPDVLGDPVFNKIAQKHSKTPAQVALRFLLQRNIVVIPKSVTLQRIEQNVDLFRFNLNDDEMKDLYALGMGEAGRVINFKMYKG